jgi:DNA (cytosine-5)-methyltransferase 1
MLGSICRDAYESNSNSQFVEKSVDEIEGEMLLDWFGKTKVTLLAGCAPCQPFSRYSIAANNRMSPM